MNAKEIYTNVFDHVSKPPILNCDSCDLIISECNQLELQLIERIEFLNKRIENIMNIIEEETDVKTYSKIEKSINFK